MNSATTLRLYTRRSTGTSAEAPPIPVSASLVGGARRFRVPRRLRRAAAVALPGTMEQHLVVRTILLANELERPIERLDRSFERPFDVATAQTQLVDVALHFLEPALRLLQQQIGAALRFADDQLGFGLCRFL